MAAALAPSASLQAQASALSQPRLEASARPLKSAASVAKAFGVRNAAAKVSCSVEEDVRSFVQKVADVGKATAVTLAAAAMIAAAPAQAIPARLTFDELQGLTYSEMKGTGVANQCPVLGDGASDGFKIPAGKYQMQKFCMEPTSFTVKAEGSFKGEGEAFQKTKLMTRLTYTLDEMEGPVAVSPDGTVTLQETDGIDYAAVTVQLSGGERVPFLFTVKELQAAGKPDAISGSYLVPSYRGSSFLDPKGRGGSTGYDNAVALPAGGRGDEEELGKENQKNTAALTGNITLSVAKSNTQTGEVAGVFVSVQPSDTDLGAKVPKDVKIEGIWYAQLQ